MVLLLYLLHLMLALLIALPMGSVIETSIGSSLELTKLLADYDHTVVSDLLNVHGEAIGLVFSQIKWVLLLYLLLLAGMRGGMLAVMQEQPAVRQRYAFWIGSLRFYSRFLRLGLLMLLLQMLAAALVLVPFGFVVSKAIGPGFTERGILLSLLPVLLLFYALLSLLMTVSQYAHVAIVREDSPRIWPAIRAAFRTVGQAPGKTWGLFLFHTGLVLLLYSFYLLLSGAIGMSGVFTLLIAFLLQQVFVYVRILAKVLSWSSAMHMDTHLNPSNDWPVFAEESQ